MSRVCSCLLLAACAVAPASADPASWFHAEGHRAFATAPLDGGWVVVGGQPARVGQVSCYGSGGDRVATLRLGDDVAYCVDVRGDRVAIGMADGRLVSVSSPALLEVTTCWRHPRPVVAVAFAPDGEVVASAGHDGIVRVGAPIADAPFVSLEHTSAATCVAWSSDGHRIASGAVDGKVRLHTREGRLLRTWNRLGGEVVAVSWHGQNLQCEVRPTPIGPIQRRELLDD